MNVVFYLNTYNKFKLSASSPNINLSYVISHTTTREQILKKGFKVFTSRLNIKNYEQMLYIITS